MQILSSSNIPSISQLQAGHEVFLSLVAYVLFALAAVISAANWVYMIGRIVKGKGGTAVLVFGGAFGFLGCVIHPVIPWQFGFVALALDPGCFCFLGVYRLFELLFRKFGDDERRPT